MASDGEGGGGGTSAVDDVERRRQGPPPWSRPRGSLQVASVSDAAVRQGASWAAAVDEAVGRPRQPAGRYRVRECAGSQ